MAYTYNANRKANRPFASLLFTALNGRTKKRLDSQNDASYRRWANTEWWEGGYEGLWLNNSEDVEQQDDKEGLSDNNDCRSRSDKANVVYLTADSSEELNELKEDETYVLGGICDHNRYKVSLSSCQYQCDYLKYLNISCPFYVNRTYVTKKQRVEGSVRLVFQ